MNPCAWRSPHFLKATGGAGTFEPIMILPSGAERRLSGPGVPCWTGRRAYAIDGRVREPHRHHQGGPRLASRDYGNHVPVGLGRGACGRWPGICPKGHVVHVVAALILDKFSARKRGDDGRAVKPEEAAPHLLGHRARHGDIVFDYLHLRHGRARSRSHRDADQPHDNRSRHRRDS
jgi:hypothetical protein